MEDNSLVLLSSQFAFGFEKPVLSPENSFVKITDSIPGVFGESPTIEPIPFIVGDDDLNNTPVVVSFSENERYQLNIARSRIDFFIKAESSESSFDDIKSDFYEKIISLAEVIPTFAEIKWIGIVSAYIFTQDNSDRFSKIIINNSLLDINGGESNSFFVRNTNRISVGDVLSNNLIAIGTGQTKKAEDDTLVDGVLFNQDFNTKASDNDIDVDFVNTYIENVYHLIKEKEIKRFLIGE